MPTPFLKSLASKHGLSLEKVESYWEDAKNIANQKFKTQSEKFWSFVTYLTKRMCKSKQTFKEFLQSKGLIK